MCWYAGREAIKEKNKEEKKGEKIKEEGALLSHSFHSLFSLRYSACIRRWLPPAVVCHKMTRYPLLCEPDKDVSGFHRHLISLPITFTKIALTGSLEGEIIIDLSQLSASFKQTSRRRGNIENVGTHSQSSIAGPIP